jgi:3-oxoacyl-(acyl-carrier-protein) synthase
MEDLTTARERGAGQVYAEVLGHAATFDSTVDGPGLAPAMALALNRAGCSPERVDLILADGAGDPAGDAAEAAAIRSVFGPRAHTVPVSVPKSMTGRLHSGAAALDVATGALAIRHNRLPPTVNVPANPYELNLVTQSRPADVACVLVLARGHGGFHSALVLHRLET